MHWFYNVKISIKNIRIVILISTSLLNKLLVILDAYVFFTPIFNKVVQTSIENGSITNIDHILFFPFFISFQQ